MKPEFFSTSSDFRVVLKNVNFNLYSNPQDNPQDNRQIVEEKIIEFCTTSKSRKEITEYCGYKDTRYFAKYYLNPLLICGKIKMTLPDKPNSKNQRYIKV